MDLRTLRHPGGWCIVPIHYSMDAEKDPVWAAKEKRKYPMESDWEREMELGMRSLAGNSAYPHWNHGLHVVEELKIIPGVPLCLTCDFNVRPMVWLVCQVFRRVVHVIEEVVGLGISIPDLVTEFRNAYPTHNAPLYIYGDAAGNNPNAQTALSDYDLLRSKLKGYPPPLEWKVPKANPPVKGRLAAVNNCLKDADGRSWVKVHQRCEYLIADMAEVVLDDKNGIKKVTDQMNPYSQRTHASDAVGYLIYREFPVWEQVQQPKPQRPREQRYGRLLGEL